MVVDGSRRYIRGLELLAKTIKSAREHTGITSHTGISTHLNLYVLYGPRSVTIIQIKVCILITVHYGNTYAFPRT